MSQRKPPDLIHSAAIHLLRRVAREDDASGIRPAQLSALSVLAYRGALTLTELADAERVTPPTMTRIVDALERDGLARRQPHYVDGRAVLVALTPKGRRRFQRARDRRLATLDELFAGATRAELATLARAAEIVERALRDA
jgi:DNA-binding MarR family transcriptional regulator